MSISANFPNVFPSLELNFAQSQQLDPRVTFSRSTTAPYYDGKTSVLAEQNLVLYSQLLTNGNWLISGCTPTANSVVAPDGTTTGNLLTIASSGFCLQQISVVAGATYTASFYALAGTSTTVNYFVYNVTNSSNIVSTVNYYPSINSSTWTRISFSFTVPVGCTSIYLDLARSSGAGTVYLWGAQLEQRSSATAYNATTTSAITNYIPQLLTAPINQPRFDFNPTTGESLGLLIEQSSTNVLFYSQDISAVGYWSNALLAPTLNAATIAPDGTQTAQKLIPDSTLGIHRAFQSALSYKTASIYVKQSDSFYPYAYLGYYDGSNYNGVIINLTNGALVQNVNSPTSYVVTSVGNGWFKISLTYSGTSAYFTFSPVPASYTISGGMPSYTGNSYSGCYVWQAQAEALSFSTSPIVTTFSQVTRAADVPPKLTGSNFTQWFNYQQGTIYCSFDTPTISTSAPNMAIWGIDNGTTGQYYINKSTATLSGYEGANNASFGTITANTNQQSIYTYSNVAGSQSASGLLNGGSLATITTTIQSILPTQLTIGGYQTTSNQFTGHIKKFAFYTQVSSTLQMQSLSGS